MNKLRILLIAMLIFTAYNISASQTEVYVTRTEYYEGDTVYFKVKPGFEINPYAVAFETEYTKETLDYTGFKTDCEEIFIADSFAENGTVYAGYTKKGKNPAGEVNEITFIFKVKAEGDASIKLKKMTVIDADLTETDMPVDKGSTVAIVSPVQTPKPQKKPSVGGGDTGGNRGGKTPAISLPVVIPTPQPEIITPTPEPAVSLPFADIEKGHWAEEYILKLYEKKIISEDTKFRPDDNISRAEFIKLIAETFEIPPVYKTAEFEDCNPSAWYAGYIAAATEAGIINGSGGRVYPDSPISRQDVCVILARILKKTGETPGFTDTEKISEYAKDSVAALVSLGIVNGMGDGSFNPVGTATRAQAAKMICMAAEVER